MESKLLIVGARGQVGSCLRQQAPSGWQVLAVDRDGEALASLKAFVQTRHALDQRLREQRAAKPRWKPPVTP